MAHLLHNQEFDGTESQLIGPLLVVFFQHSPEFPTLSTGRVLDLEADVAQGSNRIGGIRSRFMSLGLRNQGGQIVDRDTS